MFWLFTFPFTARVETSEPLLPPAVTAGNLFPVFPNSVAWLTFGFVESVAIPDFHATPELIAKLNEYLEMFVGPHNYFNYTIRTEKNNPSAKRFIISFTVRFALLRENVTLLLVYVHHYFLPVFGTFDG